MDTRELALEILLAVEKGEEYSNVLIRQVLDKYDYMESRDKAFLKRVTEGTLERRIELDYVLNQFSKVPVRKMKPFIRCLLRMSVYQILYMKQAADFAVCNEAVKLAGRHKFTSLKGFVNGVLRSVIRGKDTISYPDPAKEPLQALSVRYSMPEWIVELLSKEQGAEQAATILKGLLEVHPVTVRVRDASWKPGEVKAKQHPCLPYAYQLWGTDNLRNLPGFGVGQFTVQDVSSMLVGEIAGLTGGERVLDVCAAPGGKSLHAADFEAGKVPGQQYNGTAGTVEARDVTDYKTQLIRENAERLQVTNLTVKTWDATVADETAVEQFDVVLADVPCSGLGVIGKKRDIKYRITPESMMEVVELQRHILDQVWRYVKSGGLLIYSTCTIHKAENEEQVKYLTEHFGFETESLNPYLPEILQGQTTEQGYLQLLPGVHDCDGFFLARLRKKA